MQLETNHDNDNGDLTGGSLPPLSILESVLYVHDLDEAEEFYKDVLGLSVYARDTGRHVFFELGGESMLLLFNAADTSVRQTYVNGSEIPMHGTTGIGHVALRIKDQDLSVWQDHLEQCGIPIESDVHWPNGGRSLYFRDPSGNSVELATSRLWNFPER